MGAIFISYRREDSEGHAGRLFEVLAEHFGKTLVFMDVAGIEPGMDFRKAIDSNVATCSVLLAIVGRGWLTAVDATGQRRLDSPQDFVRLETVSALKRDIPVIPVLVHGAVMPRADQLPADMSELAYRNSVELTHARWDSDVQVLINALARYVDTPDADAATTRPRETTDAQQIKASPRRKVAVMAVLAALVAGGGVMAYQHYRPDPEPIHQGKPQITTPDPVQSAAAEAEKRNAELKAAADREAQAREAELRAAEEKLQQEKIAMEAERVATANKIAEAARPAQAEPDKKPAIPKPAVAITPEKPAEAPATGHPSGLRSIPGTPATTIRFINNSGRPMDVNWINFKGKEVGYLKLAPGQAFNQTTGVSHSWVVRDVKTQRLMTTAVATAEPTTVRITVPQ